MKAFLKKVFYSMLVLMLAYNAYVLVRMDLGGFFTIYAEGVTKEKFAKIHVGMTEEEVLSILPPPLKRSVYEEHGFAYKYSDHPRWTVLYRQIYVFFDENGRVVSKLNEVRSD